MARAYNIYIPLNWEQRPMAAYTVKHEAQKFVREFNSDKLNHPILLVSVM